MNKHQGTLLSAISPAKRFFLTAAGLSLIFSVYLYFFSGDKQAGIFVGIWVPSILSAGSLILKGDRNV